MGSLNLKQNLFDIFASPPPPPFSLTVFHSSNYFSCYFVNQIQPPNSVIVLTYIRSESESFESLAIVRVETLLKEALSLKESLQAQKLALISGVKNVSSLLEEPLAI